MQPGYTFRSHQSVCPRKLLTRMRGVAIEKPQLHLQHQKLEAGKAWERLGKEASEVTTYHVYWYAMSRVHKNRRLE